MEKRIEHLLKSSLILEHQVASIAAECGYYNQGEFSYSRRNEAGNASDFSIDLLAVADVIDGSELGPGKSLNVLMECKYSSPSVEWVFSKTPNYDPQTFSAFSVFNWLGDHLARNFGGMSRLEPEAYCSRGVSLSTSSADPKQIRHGLQQLRHALPSLLHSVCSIYKDHSAEMPIPVLALILVTNAPIRVLKDGVCISRAENCTSLDEITTRHMHVNVYQAASPEVKLACRTAAKELCGELENKLGIDLEESLVSELIDGVETVTVISLAALSDYLKGLKSVAEDVDVVSLSDFAIEYGKLISN
jgi:hypothetical protein